MTARPIIDDAQDPDFEWPPGSLTLLSHVGPRERERLLLEIVSVVGRAMPTDLAAAAGVGEAQVSEWLEPLVASYQLRRTPMGAYATCGPRQRTWRFLKEEVARRPMSGGLRTRGA